VLIEDRAVLTEARRAAAVEQGTRMLPALGMPMDAIARVAAQWLNAPMGAVTLVGAEHEHLAGVYQLPPALVRGCDAPLSWSVCKYVVSADHPVFSEDMTADPELRDHRLARDHGVRAFLGVPLRDADDQPLGALTVLDTRPRSWTDSDLSVLLRLGQIIGPLPTDRLDQQPPRSGATNGQPDSRLRDPFLAALLDSLDPAILGCLPDGAVALSNPAARDLLGDPPGAVPTRLADLAKGTLFRPDGTPLTVRETALWRALHGEAVDDREVVVRLPGRAERVFVVKGRPVHPGGPDGTHDPPVGAVVAMHDVTAVRRAERFYACAIEVFDALTDPEPITDRGVSVLGAVRTALRWPHAELWLADQAGVLRLAAQSSAPRQPSVTGPTTATRGEGLAGTVWAIGEPLWIPDLTAAHGLRPDRVGPRFRGYAAAGLRTALAVPVRDRQTVGVLACFSDAPEHDEMLLTALLEGIAAQLGRFLAHSQQEHLTEELSQTRQAFLGLAGHEIRTPLTSIISYTQMLRDDPTTSPELTHQLVEVISRNATTLHDVITRLLDLVDLQTSTEPMTRERVELADVLHQAAADLVRPPGVELRLEVNARPGVLGDAARLRQVLDNLLTNAVKHSAGGGLVDVCLCAGPDLVTLVVADNGTGIPADERGKVFDYFFRSTASRDQQVPGTGLGLATTRAIVQRHHGTITLTPNRPSGTVATVQLPPAPGEERADASGYSG
jgi:signal transduction histidine kinase/PAS domain-containing protein